MNGILDRLRLAVNLALGRKSAYSDYSDIQRAFFGAGMGTSAGVNVSPESSLAAPTVHACVRLISEIIATLPLITYRRVAGGGRERATDHPVYRLFHDSPNAWMTNFEYVEGELCNLLMRGNHYAYKDMDGRGRVQSLIPLNPDGVNITQAVDYSPIYDVLMPDNTRATLAANEIHHVRGPLPEGFKGRSVISVARETIGYALAAQSHGATTLRNGVTPSGVLEHPGGLKDASFKRLRDSFQETQGGFANAGKPIILEDGMKWAQVSMTANDAQFIEQRKLLRTEICSIFRVPPHLVADNERATFSNVEHQSLEFMIYHMAPWLKRIETSVNRDFFSPRERNIYYTEFLADSILRGDIKARYEAYKIGVGFGWMNRNEVRQKENMNPGPDELDEFLVPLNMADTEDANTTETGDPGDSDADA